MKLLCWEGLANEVQREILRCSHGEEGPVEGASEQLWTLGFRAKELLLGVKLNWVQQGEPVTQKQNGVMSICGPERTAEF